MIIPFRQANRDHHRAGRVILTRDTELIRRRQARGNETLKAVDHSEVREIFGLRK